MEKLKALIRLEESLAKLPSVGRRSAERMAYAMLNMEDDDLNEFSDAIKNLKQSVHVCPICGFLTEEEKCVICNDADRDQDTLMVVSFPIDVIAFENPEYYKWFGTERSSKLGMTNLNDNCIYFLPPTEEKFSVDSPAAKCADILVNVTEESDDIEYIYDGKSHTSLENEKLKELIDAVLKFNDPYLLECFDHELELYRDPVYKEKDNSELVNELDLENCLLELR